MKAKSKSSRRAKLNEKPIVIPTPSPFREGDFPWSIVDDSNWTGNLAHLFFNALQLDSDELGWLAGIASKMASKNEAAKEAAEVAAEGSK